MDGKKIEYDRLRGIKREIDQGEEGRESTTK